VRNYFNQTCGGMPSDQYPNALAGWGIVDAEAALELPETDGDEVADACDCAAQDGGVFDEPVEVSGTHFDPAELETLLWNSQAPRAGSATVYDLLRGDVAGLAADGGISGAECLADGLTEAEYSDAAVPAAGRGFYYLPRARNACATAGYGAGSGGTERENPACAP
jgi:hypothetical protein